MITKFRDLSLSIPYGKGCIYTVQKFNGVLIVFKLSDVNGFVPEHFETRPVIFFVLIYYY